MSKQNKTETRRRFVLWGLNIMGALAAANFLFVARKKRKSTTVKMLSQDGKLVELDITKLPQQRKQTRITDTELQQWVKNK
ncbi:MAG: hypothetical protein SFU87_01520 [Chitinophagaceae bacterium]|nr:hypothetical protein [Chitinophagaceae bacterium]